MLIGLKERTRKVLYYLSIRILLLSPYFIKKQIFTSCKI